MDKAQQFLDWWHRQRADDTALYPDPKAIARDAHSKNPQALVIEFENRWPKVRRDVFRLLESARKPLAKQFKAASVEWVKWAKNDFVPGFIGSVSNALGTLREGRYSLDSFAASFWPGQHSSGITDSAMAAFQQLGGEAALAKGMPLHSLVKKWLQECLRWYESAKVLSKDAPPLLWTLKPCFPWSRKGQESILDDLEPATKSPICGVLTGGAFIAQMNDALQIDWRIESGELRSCADIFELVLRTGTLYRFKTYPESGLKLSDAASINPWCVAVALDKTYQARDESGIAVAQDWLAQIQVAFKSWVNTRMGADLRVDTFEYGVDFRPIGTNAPLIRHLVGCFAKPRDQRSWESCAFLIGFALDTVLDHVGSSESASPSEVRRTSSTAAIPENTATERAGRRLEAGQWKECHILLGEGVVASVSSGGRKLNVNVTRRLRIALEQFALANPTRLHAATAAGTRSLKRDLKKFLNSIFNVPGEPIRATGRAGHYLCLVQVTDKS